MDTKIFYENTVKEHSLMPKYIERMQDLKERFLFREILQEEAEQAAAIEKICFPPNEACSEKMMHERVAIAPELF